VIEHYAARDRTRPSPRQQVPKCIRSLAIRATMSEATPAHSRRSVAIILRRARKRPQTQSRKPDAMARSPRVQLLMPKQTAGLECDSGAGHPKSATTVRQACEWRSWIRKNSAYSEALQLQLPAARQNNATSGLPGSSQRFAGAVTNVFQGRERTLRTFVTALE
jgi:hypothetical protein